MSLLVETIKVIDGNIMNISEHNERMYRSLYEIYGLTSSVDLRETIIVPETARIGIFKCRVTYDNVSVRMEFLPYKIRPVNSLRLVYDETISYSHKYVDRDAIKNLFEKRGDCDDILIIKAGFVTDTSYANIIFRDFDGKWLTPYTCLLPGTRRKSLLQSGLIKEALIPVKDIRKFTQVKLINAMLDIGDTDGFSVRSII